MPKLCLRMLDLRRLLLLRELHARRTIAAVAEALSYSPSAVSQQLSQLEREAGVELLERVGRNVRLTEAALLLVAHADALLSRMELAEAEIARVNSEPRGTVRIASFQTIGVALLPLALSRLARDHPSLSVEYLEAEAEESLPLVIKGALDLAIGEEYEHAPRPRESALERRDIVHDPILIAVPQDHPLARGPEIALADLAAERWATSRTGTALAEMVAGACRTLGGFEPEIRYRANNMGTLSSLVASGHAVAMIPGLGAADHARVAVRRVAEEPLARRIFIAVRRASTPRPALAAVADALSRTAAAMDAETETLSVRGRV
jgi:DNA-binding transcriptional LysR family regulator